MARNTLGDIEYLYVDARYEKVRYNDEVRDCAVLIALGIDKDGKRDILGRDASFTYNKMLKTTLVKKA